MVWKTAFMNTLAPIYNSRLLKFYTAYLNTHYPHVDLDALLRDATISKHELDDPGHWFNQRQVDLFYERVLAATGNPAVARVAGRFAVSTDASGPIKQHALGLLNISSIYLLLTKLYPMLSRGARVDARKLDANRVEIIVQPESGVQEKPYQCENRLGVFESLAMLFTAKNGTIDHDKCIHRGDDRCRYVVSWEEPAYRKWKRYMRIGLVVAVIAGAAAAFILPRTAFLAVLAFGAVGLMGLGRWADYLEKQELVRTIQNQGNVAEDHIKEVDYRYRGAMLIQKIGQATAALMDVNQLAQVVVDNIQNYLDFDRGIIMLADPAGKQLEYAAGFGFDGDKIQILKTTRFRLDNPEARGPFVQALRERRPILVDDVNTMQDAFSARTQSFAKHLGSQSLICLPIVYEQESLGILAVDNLHTKRPLTQSDANLLMGVAYQAAVSIFGSKAYKKLQDSEEQYRSLYDKAPTAYFSISAENATIVNCNLAAARLLGHARDELIGSNWLDYCSSDEGGRDRAGRIVQDVKQGRSIHNEEVQWLHKDGHAVWTHLSLEPFNDAQGSVSEVRCILVDTTERKKLEAQLRHAQRMEAMGTLAGGVAHDLSNILAAIVSYPDLLLMDIDSNSQMYEPLTKIKRAGMRAAAIVQDLLTLARRGVQLTEVIDFNDIVAEFLKSPECDRLRVYHPDVILATDLYEQPAAIRGSAVHLIKGLMNVVTNAAEAMPDGGKILIATCKQPARELERIKDKTKEDYVVVSVTDNGTGIAREDIDRIFEPFFTKKVMGRSGTGLGMAIVWATVQDHNGFVEVQSETGKGTTVRLIFPATAEVRVQPLAIPVLKDLMGRGETILVIDDEAEHRDIASQMLTRLGYRVVTVDSGPAALEQMQKQPPDLVVLDMILGSDMDGLAVYRRILSLQPDQKAVITSGFAETSRVRQAMQLGAGAYIKKPYGLKEIASVVRQALEEPGGQDASPAPRRDPGPP
jgi:PAS domain S-box-containing protein